MWGGSVAELHTEPRAKVWPLDQTKYAQGLLSLAQFLDKLPECI